MRINWDEDIRDPDFDERPHIVGKCKHCWQPVRTFDVRVEIGGNMYHYDCLYGMTTDDLILELGGEIKSGGRD